MNGNNLFRKALVFIVVVLFFCVSVVPCINGFFDNSVVVKNFGEQVAVDSDIGVSEFATVRVFPLGVNCFRAREVVLSVGEVRVIQDRFYNLINSSVGDPFGVETQQLKYEFFEFLEERGLFSGEHIYQFLSFKDSPLIARLNKKNNILYHPSPQTSDDHNATLLLCSMLGGGWGFIFPPVLLPRPRFVMQWRGFYEDSSVSAIAEMHTGRGVIARGAQIGTSFGFIGIGFAFALPGAPAQFGFLGYSLLTRIQAYKVNWYYANFPPIVMDESPVNESLGVPLSLSELSFSLKDFDRDKMSYSVSTFPDIGSGSGVSVSDGSFFVPVYGLEGSTEYHWQAEVTDGFDTTLEDFWFRTEETAPVVSDPFPVDGGVDVSVNLSFLQFTLEEPQGDLMDFSVETFPDIGSGSGTGVSNGTYTVSVSGLKSMTEYVWFVNGTDGVFWTHKTFHFQTEVAVFFDPFLEGWQYRKSVTIDHTRVAGNLLNFPVLVSVVDLDLRDKAQVDGDDILFMDGPGVANKLYHEIEMFDGSSGEFVAWVKIPSLSSSVDTVFYLYYGNPVCGSQQVVDKVWDSNYIHVWHLGDDLVDSVGFDDGTNHGTSIISGKIGKGRDFEQSESDYIDFGDMAQPADGSLATATLEVWLETSSTPNNICLANKYDTSGTDYTTYANVLVSHDGTKYKIQYNQYAGNLQSVWVWRTDSTHFLTDGSWQYLAFGIACASETTNIYYNGLSKSVTKIEDSGTGPTVFTNIGITDEIGRIRYESSTPYYTHGIDEIRWSKIVRSDEWIKTSYNTMNDPSSFLSFGPEESPP